MKPTITALGIAALLALSSCGEAPDDEPTDTTEESGATFGETPAGQGKDDDIGARHLVWLNDDSQDIPIDDVTHTGTATVELATTRDVKWSADRIVLSQKEGERVNVAIDADGWLTDISQDIGFGLYYRLEGSDSWHTVAIPAAFDGEQFEVFIFESVEMDAEREAIEINAVIPTSAGIFRQDGKVPFEGFGGQDLEWAVLPIPIGRWGDLEGEYPYALDADCDGVACTQER